MASRRADGCTHLRVGGLSEQRCKCCCLGCYYEAVGEPKTLWEIPEAGNTGGLDARPREYERRVILRRGLLELKQQ